MYVQKYALHKNFQEEKFMKNEILKELWKTKDQIAKEHGYDIEKLAKELRQKEKEEANKVVDLSKDIRKASQLTFMKSNQDFEAVKMKNKIRAQWLKEQQGMSNQEARSALQKALHSSKSPVAHLWRKLQKNSSTEKAAQKYEA